MDTREEKANFFTHAVGLVLALIGFIILLESAQNGSNKLRQLSFIIYGVTIVLLFASSTFYHYCTNPKIKGTLRIIDHIAIYLLIAGTYTPFLLIPLHGTWGWSLLILIWTVAVAGAVLKLWFTGRYNQLSTTIYLAMGWLAVVAIKPMFEQVPPASLTWLVIGGLCYTGGVYFYNKSTLRYHHAVWHLFVLAGSVCHFVSISQYL